MIHVRALLAASGLFVAVATSAVAQAVNYSTTGRFTSGSSACNQVVATSSVTCTNAGFSLLFMGTTGVNIGSGSVVSLGTFLLTGTGTQVVPQGVVTFELFINQTTPTPGVRSFSGSVFGTVMTGMNGDVSTLIWTPGQFSTIGPVTYTMIYDNAGPAKDRGIGIPINNRRGINAIVNTSVVPEPSTTALMTAGMFALLGLVSRRRRA